MEKDVWRGGNMLYPLPVVMVSCANAAGESDIVTVAWTGTVCTNPPMLYVSLRPERHSYHIVRESGEFVVNLVSGQLMRACDWCGVRSGRDFDKWAECGLTPAPSRELALAPAIAEAPVSLECAVTEVKELGSHHMFLAEVKAVQVDPGLVDADGKLDLARAGLVAYSHGEYFDLGQRLGTFGYSVRKKKPQARGGRAKPNEARSKGKDGRAKTGDRRPGPKGAGGHRKPKDARRRP